MLSSYLKKRLYAYEVDDFFSDAEWHSVFLRRLLCFFESFISWSTLFAFLAGGATSALFSFLGLVDVGIETRLLTGILSYSFFLTGLFLCHTFLPFS